MKAQSSINVGVEELPEIDIQVPTEITAPADIFMCTSPQEVARQLVFISSQLFRKIAVTELLNQAWDTDKFKYLAPNVIALIRRTDQISNWVASTILTGETGKERAAIITRFIQIAVVCTHDVNLSSKYNII